MKHRFACAAFVAAIFSSTSTFAESWEVTKLVPGSAFHGVHGLGIDKAGHLFAGSVAGAALYEVDIAGGTAKIAIPAPIGMADDIAFAPDGTMAWTGFLAGDLYSRKGDGPIKKLASGLPGINSLAYRKDGRLYATTVFLGDTLYEIDVEGVKPPRQIMEKMGGLNGFEFGPDDKLYGPALVQGTGRQGRRRQGRADRRRRRFQGPGRGELRFQRQSLGGRYRARPARSGRSQVRRQDHGRATEAVAGQSRDRRQGPHLRLQHGRQRHPGGRSGDWPGEANHHRQARFARRHRRHLGQRQGYDSRRRRVRLSHGGRRDRRSHREGAHARRRRHPRISDERDGEGQRRDPVELVHRHGAGDRRQDRRHARHAARLQGAA